MEKNKKIIVAILILSVILNAYFIFFPKKLTVVKDITWSLDSVSARGYLEPVNYKGPNDWNTIFFVDVLNTTQGKGAKFFAKEVVVTNGVLVSLGLKEYSIVEIDNTRIVAQDDIYRFEVTKNEVLITDKDGETSRLSNMYGIKL